MSRSKSPIGRVPTALGKRALIAAPLIRTKSTPPRSSVSRTGRSFFRRSTPVSQICFACPPIQASLWSEKPSRRMFSCRSGVRRNSRPSIRSGLANRRHLPNASTARPSSLRQASSSQRSRSGSVRPFTRFSRAAFAAHPETPSSSADSHGAAESDPIAPCFARECDAGRRPPAAGAIGIPRRRRGRTRRENRRCAVRDQTRPIG